MQKQAIYRLNNLTTRLEELYRSLNISIYTNPLNHNEERVLLLDSYKKDTIYNPQFIYRVPPTNWSDLLYNFAQELKPDNVWEALIYTDVYTTLDSLIAIQTHSPEAITEHTLRIYGLPSTENIALAKKCLLHKTEERDEHIISSNQISQILKQALVKVALYEWKVVLEISMNARISVSALKKLVKIRADEFFTADEAKRLLIHEIGTHVFRTVNGQNQPLKILSLGLNNYMLTEEGLATYHEHLYGIRNAQDSRRYALRLIAANMSLTNDFFTVFCEISKYTTLQEAFDIVARAKRGFEDTSKHGSHLKDKVYFEGFHIISNHLTTSPDDYKLLMSGKISLEMLPIIHELQVSNLLQEPRYLPNILL